MATLTRGLQNLQRQLDAAFPDRKRPDGWIGDADHRARTSGHNPDDTPGSKPAWNGDPDSLAEVRALDPSADLGPGVDPQDLVDHLVRLPGLSTVVRYLIFDGWWYHTATGFARRRYLGSNPHRKHIHVEGAWSQSADNNTSFDFRLQEVPVALTDADKKWLTAQIDAAAVKAAKEVWATKFDIEPGDDKTYLATAGSILLHIPGEHTRIEKAVGGLAAG